MDSEKLAISYLLYNPNAIKEFISYGISADFFLNTINKAIFKVMSRYFVLYAKGISKIELEQELQKIQIGAETYTPHITFTTEDVYDISPEWLVKQLTDNKKRSILVNGVQKIAGDVNTNNVWDAEKELIKITKQISQMNSSSSVICNFNDDVYGMSKMLNIPKNERKILTGYKEFDSVINGFKPGWLVVLAARPKTGKSRTMINLVANMIKQGTNVIAFTLEMPKEQYVNLFFSCMTGIPYYKFEERILTESELAQVKELQSRLTTEYGKLIIVDTLKGVSPDYIAAKTEEMEIQFGTTFDVIAIDHATMMKPNRSMDNDWLAQGSIAEDLRSIGREMNKVVLTALQVKRGEKTKKSGNTGSDPGGDLSRSDIWYQTLDVLIVIQKPEGDDETSVLSTLKFKIISRYSEPQTVELVKDFNITSLYSIADSSLEKGIVSLWHKAGSGDES